MAAPSRTWSRSSARPRPQLVAAPTLLASLLVAGVLAAVFRLALHGVVQPETALAFGGLIILGEALRITLPGDRDNAPLAATAALGYALAPRLCDHVALWGPVQVIVVVAGAAAIGSLPQALVGRPPSVGYLVRRIGVAGAAAWLLRSVLGTTADHATGMSLLLLLSAMACLALLLDSALAALFAISSVDDAPSPLTAYPDFADSATPLGVVGSSHLSDYPAASAATAPAALRRSTPTGATFPRLLRRFAGSWLEECAATARVCPAVAALCVAVALAAGPMGLWVLPIAAAPVLVMQRALRRYAAIRATYQQTVRALSRVTDLAGYTDPGHARRVCRLALALGRDLELTEPELLDLEYAALLHDIGQLSLADPLPGGATVLATPWVAAEVAVRGAEVVRETGVLDRVARVLEAQVAPYRAAPTPATSSTAGAAAPNGGVAAPPLTVDEGELLAAAILRVANDFEDLRAADPGPAAHAKALARMRRGIGNPYDPQVVEALTRLLAVE